MMRDLGNGWVRGVITHDQGDDYTHQAIGADGLEFRAPAPNKGGNFREGITRTSTPPSIDHESCVTWHGPVSSGVIQPGVVLRANTEHDRTRLIMVTNNVIFGLRGGINIHFVDTTLANPHPQLAGKSVGTIGEWGGRHPLPWRICAQVVGKRVKAKGWSTSNPEPAWDDTQAVVTATVPDSHFYAGRPGVYMGHIRPGESTRLTHHTNRTLEGPGDNLWNTMLAVFRPQITKAIGAAPSEVDIARLTARISQGEPLPAATDAAMSDQGRKHESKILFERALGRTIQNPGVLQQSPTDRLHTLTNSAEFKSGASTTNEWVLRLYQRLLGRTPGVSEVNHWVGKISSGTSRKAVVKSFWLSDENARRVTNETYLDIHGRAPKLNEQNEGALLFRLLDGDTTILRSLVATRGVPTP